MYTVIPIPDRRNSYIVISTGKAKYCVNIYRYDMRIRAWDGSSWIDPDWKVEDPDHGVRSAIALAALNFYHSHK